MSPLVLIVFQWCDLTEISDHHFFRSVICYHLVALAHHNLMRSILKEHLWFYALDFKGYFSVESTKTHKLMFQNINKSSKELIEWPVKSQNCHYVNSKILRFFNYKKFLLDKVMLAIELSMAKKVVKFLENNFLSLCELKAEIPFSWDFFLNSGVALLRLGGSYQKLFDQILSFARFVHYRNDFSKTPWKEG